MEILGELSKVIQGKLLVNEPMTKHTSFGIGGPAKAFLYPDNEEDLANTLKFSATHNIPVYFIGSGTNLLVSDQGFDGFVISLQKTFKAIRIDGKHVFVQTGTMMGHFVKECIKNNLTGVESLIGVPGTLGGAIKMNAGAYGREISNSLTLLNVVTLQGEKKQYRKGEIEFGYRYSSIPNNEIITSVEFEFKIGVSKEINRLKAKASQSRKQSQPLRFRSAGSVFKNPSKDQSAGYLIEQAGLKGTRRGDAEISTKHANFFINKGNATAEDIVELVHLARDRVKEKFSVDLQLEIETLGFPPNYLDA